MLQNRFFIILFCIFGLGSHVRCDELQDSLNGMQNLLTGENEYDPEFYAELVECLESVDPKLLESVNAQWTGFKDYAASGGNPPEDVWKNCSSDLQWFEVNCTVQEYGQIPIWEPCNYASNMAYYHTVTELCARKKETWSMPEESVRAIKKAFASLGVGSCFLHGSNTTVGEYSDVRVNDLFGWIVYQEGIRNLPTEKSSVIYELSLTPRNMSAIAVVDYLMNAYIDEPVKDWGVILKDADFPTLARCMSGMFTTIFTLLLPPEIVETLVPILIDFFGWIFDEGTKEFILDHYLPEIQNATAHMLPLSEEEKSKLTGNVIGTLLKLGYAFLWQEQAVPLEILLKPKINEIGTMLLPTVNEFATGLTTFEHSSPDFQHGINFFPGQGWCNPVNSHSKWHLETGIALPDLAFLFDEIHRLIGDANSKTTTPENPTSSEPTTMPSQAVPSFLLTKPMLLVALTVQMIVLAM